MYCPQCGAQISQPARFCPVCGEAINQYREETAEAKAQNTDLLQGAMEPVSLPDEKKTMVEPLSTPKRRRRILSVVLGATLLLCVVGIGAYFIDSAKEGDSSIFSRLIGKGEEKDGDAPGIQGVSEAFYEQGMAYLEKYTDEAQLSNARTIGFEAFEQVIADCSGIMSDFKKSGGNEAEQLFAQVVGMLCVYELANDYETARFEQSIGPADEEGKMRLQTRITNGQALVGRLKNAATVEELEGIIQDAEPGVGVN